MALTARAPEKELYMHISSHSDTVVLKREKYSLKEDLSFAIKNVGWIDKDINNPYTRGTR